MNHQFPQSLGHRLPSRRQPQPRADYDEVFTEDFPVTYSPVKAGVFNIYLFGMIEHATQFISAIEVLSAASEADVVVIHLSTPGGSLDATDTFLAAMHECEARVIVRATGGVHSAGSVILLHADEFTLSENFNCLIHNGSTGAIGDFNKFIASAKHSQDYMENVMRSTYAGFLTEEELDQMIEGKDFWLGPEEFSERHDARNEYLKALVEELEAEEAEPVVKPKRKRTPKAA